MLARVNPLLAEKAQGNSILNNNNWSPMVTFAIAVVSTVAQKGHVHYPIQYFPLPISTFLITNFYFSFPILSFLITNFLFGYFLFPISNFLIL